jgi:colanic acid/amylovoran biosynthesis glycosyltransferase
MITTDTSKPTVAHLVDTYLFVTGSWIYGQLTHLKQFRAIVLTSHTENLDVFPFQPLHLYDEFTDRSDFIGSVLRSVLEALTQRRLKFHARTCREEAVKLLHAHFGTEGYHRLPLKRTLNVPLVTTFYGADISEMPAKSRWRRRYRRLFKEGNLFLFEGPYMAQTAVDLGCPPSKTRVIHLGVDLDRIAFRARALKSDAEPVRILMAASFREKKGIPYGIRAFARATRRVPNLELTIIGGARSRSERRLMHHCAAIVRREGIADRVRFMGYVPYPSYLREQRRSHIFLAPSVTARSGDTEGGAPVSIIEASAAGMPIVSTRHCDIPEVVVDGVSGVLVPERNVEALSRAIVDIVASPESWREIGQAGRAHVEAEYDIRVQVAKLEQVYQQAV